MPVAVWACGSLAGQPETEPTGTAEVAGRRLRQRGMPAALPVLPALRSLLPGNGLRRGGAVSVSGGVGATSLLLALLAGVSSAGGWCAAVRLPTLGPLAAADLGVDLARLVAVPAPGPRWVSVAAGLLEGFDAVAIRPPTQVGTGDARRLAGRARERGAVLLAAGAWPGAELRMSVSAPRWHGLGTGGHGRLRARHLTVRVEGRGAAARPRLARVWLPAPEGGCLAAPAEPVTRPGWMATGVGN